VKVQRSKDEQKWKECVEKVLEKVIGARIVGVEFDKLPLYDYTCLTPPTVETECIEYDYGDMVLVLDNGIRLRFWTSEWGGMDVERGEEGAGKEE